MESRSASKTVRSEESRKLSNEYTATRQREAVAFRYGSSMYCSLLNADEPQFDCEHPVRRKQADCRGAQPVDKIIADAWCRAVLQEFALPACTKDDIEPIHHQSHLNFVEDSSRQWGN